MAEIVKNKFVRKGDWRTLESGWNSEFGCLFRDPSGAQVKLRKGLGWLGWDSQKKTLNGFDKSIDVRGAVYSRVQIKVLQDTEVRYVYKPTGP